MPGGAFGMTGQRHLRLVEPTAPPRPRRINVRIVVSSARMLLSAGAASFVSPKAISTI